MSTEKNSSENAWFLLLLLIPIAGAFLYYFATKQTKGKKTISTGSGSNNGFQFPEPILNNSNTVTPPKEVLSFDYSKGGENDTVNESNNLNSMTDTDIDSHIFKFNEYGTKVLYLNQAINAAIIRLGFTGKLTPLSTDPMVNHVYNNDVQLLLDQLSKGTLLPYKNNVTINNINKLTGSNGLNLVSGSEVLNVQTFGTSL